MGLRGMFSVEAYSVIVVSHPSISLRRKRLFFCVLDVHMCIANRPVRHVAKHAPLCAVAVRSTQQSLGCGLGLASLSKNRWRGQRLLSTEPVSYTHLTLPTILLV